jgi:hypothetical protein
MGKGFAPVKAKSEKPLAKSAKLNPISQIQADLSSYFTDIKDPRVNRTKKHLLKDILVMAILAIIAGAEGWEDIENYGYAKQQWLSEFLELPHGIPSDDSFRRNCSITTGGGRSRSVDHKVTKQCGFQLTRSSY